MSTALLAYDHRQTRREPAKVRELDGARGARPDRCQPTAGPVRLTRRGRLVISAALPAVVFAAFMSFGSPAVSTDEAHHYSTGTVVVEPGQTLWDIAQTVAPSEDPRDVIAEIVDLNSLPDEGAIQPGQSLYVPEG